MPDPAAPAQTADAATPEGAQPSAARGFLLIISGPSGVGKSTLTNALLQRMDADLSISMTTRPPAASDVDGKHYFFVDVPIFEQAIEAGRLLEHAVYAGNFYGTPRHFVEEKLAAGRVVILEIDTEGARQVKTAMPEALALFIKAPDEAALLTRLRGRKREDEATIQKRFSIAKKEIAFAESSHIYDTVVINDDFDRAVQQIEKIIKRKLEEGREPLLF